MGGATERLGEVEVQEKCTHCTSCSVTGSGGAVVEKVPTAVLGGGFSGLTECQWHFTGAMQSRCCAATAGSKDPQRSPHSPDPTLQVTDTLLLARIWLRQKSLVLWLSASRPTPNMTSTGVAHWHSL